MEVRCWYCDTPRKVDDNLYVEECPKCGDEEYDSDNYDRQEEEFNDMQISEW